mmetsp:Transcript_18185/g.43532  ORF Transcript_18185/g.43532 Transcript_18185/m.43532 type:complete len:226 (-) Transcript_18185:326-1003(-)
MRLADQRGSRTPQPLCCCCRFCPPLPVNIVSALTPCRCRLGLGILVPCELLESTCHLSLDLSVRFVVREAEVLFAERLEANPDPTANRAADAAVARGVGADPSHPAVAAIALCQLNRRPPAGCLQGRHVRVLEGPGTLVALFLTAVACPSMGRCRCAARVRAPYAAVPACALVGPIASRRCNAPTRCMELVEGQWRDGAGPPLVVPSPWLRARRGARGRRCAIRL